MQRRKQSVVQPKNLRGWLLKSGSEWVVRETWLRRVRSRVSWRYFGLDDYKLRLRSLDCHKITSENILRQHSFRLRHTYNTAAERTYGAIYVITHLFTHYCAVNNTHSTLLTTARHQRWKEQTPKKPYDHPGSHGQRQQIRHQRPCQGLNLTRRQ